MSEPIPSYGLAEPPRSIAPNGIDVLIAAVVFAVLLALFSGGTILLRLSAPDLFTSQAGLLGLTVILLSAQCLALLAAVALALRRRGGGLATVGLLPLGWRGATIAILLGVLIAFGLSAVLYGLQQAMHLPSKTPGAEMLAPAGFSWLGWGVMLLVAGLLAPFAEEVMFRGLVFGWLRQRLRPSLAALVSALPFGLLHIQPQHILYAGAAGFFLALIYQRSGSLWSSIAAHMAINIIAVSEVYIALAMGVPLDQI